MTTYRVSPTAGVDAAGRDGSINAPWATWTYAATRVTPAAGDRFLQDAGSVAREALPGALMAADSVYLGVYGDSAEAVLCGSEIATGWAWNDIYELWSLAAASGWNVAIGGYPLSFVAWDTNLATTVDQMTDWSFTRDPATSNLYVKSTEPPERSEVSARQFCISGMGATNPGLIIEGIEFRGSYRHGIYSNGRNDMLVRQCRFGVVGGEFVSGVYLGNHLEIYGTCEGVDVRDNVFVDAFDSCVSPQLSSTANQTIKRMRIMDNVIRRAGYAGIEATFNGTGQAIRGCEFFGNRIEDMGRNCWSGDRGGRGIAVSNNAADGTNVASGLRIYHNTMKRCVRGVRMVNTQGRNKILSNDLDDCNEALLSYQSINAAGHEDWFSGNVVRNSVTAGFKAESAWPVTSKLINNTFRGCAVAVKNNDNAAAVLECTNNLIYGGGVAFQVSVGTFVETYTRVGTDTTPGRTLDGTSAQLDVAGLVDEHERLVMPDDTAVAALAAENALAAAGSYVRGSRLSDGVRPCAHAVPIGAHAAAARRESIS